MLVYRKGKKSFKYVLNKIYVEFAQDLYFTYTPAMPIKMRGNWAVPWGNPQPSQVAGESSLVGSEN